MNLYNNNLKKLDLESLENERLSQKIQQKDDQIKENAENINNSSKGQVEDFQKKIQMLIAKTETLGKQKSEFEEIMRA